MSKIFVSYRRADSASACGRIYERLVARFGRENVFKDVDSIPAAEDFKAYIERVIPQCAIQLVVIGQRWLDVTDPQGQRRLDDPQDFVRMEIETALQHGIPLMPILVEDGRMPPVSELPTGIQSLATRNALPVRYDPDFDTDMGRVIAAIQRYLPVPAPVAARPQGAPPPTSAPRPGNYAAPAPMYHAPVAVSLPYVPQRVTRPPASWRSVFPIAMIIAIPTTVINVINVILTHTGTYFYFGGGSTAIGGLLPLIPPVLNVAAMGVLGILAGRGKGGGAGWRAGLLGGTVLGLGTGIAGGAADAAFNTQHSLGGDVIDVLFTASFILGTSVAIAAIGGAIGAATNGR